MLLRLRQGLSAEAHSRSRKLHAKLTPVAKFALNRDRRSQSLAEVFHNGEAQTTAAAFAGSVPIDTVESFENSPKEFLADTCTGVPHDNGFRELVSNEFHRDAAACLRVF